MIGFDFLGQSAFTIDYVSKKIVFGPIDASLAAIPYQSRPGYVVVEMQIQQQQLLLLVDTGASDLIFFGSGVRDCPLAIRIVGSRTWSNMGGEETGGAARRAAGFVRGDLPEDSARGLRP